MNLATGQVEARYEYGPFGEPLRAEGGPIAQANPFRFATKFVDAETGLSFYGHRYYSAALGRWLSRDPIAESGGLNLYAMVGNDALNGIDVLGLAGNPDQCCENGAALVTDDNGVLCCPEKIKVNAKTGKRTCVVATTNPPKAAGGDDDVPVTFSDPCAYEHNGPGTWGYRPCAGGTPSNPTDNSRTSGGGGCGSSSSDDSEFWRSGAGMWLEDFGSVWKGIGRSVLGSVEGLLAAANPVNQLTTAYGVVSDPMGAVAGVSAAFQEAGNTLSAAASGDKEAAGEIIGAAWFTAVTAAAGGALGGTASAAKSGVPAYRTWNQFQSGTAGQFASRAEAGLAWSAYKQANGIVTGATRSSAARSEFLRGMADCGKAPSWMNQWLQQGKAPPGYHVDHIKSLSTGGADAPSNMRLLDIDMHKMHHRYYRPWE